jgi:arsenate reductase
MRRIIAERPNAVSVTGAIVNTKARELAALGMLVLLISAADASSGQTARGGSSATERPATVLFMCPHGAAKSVLASAYFQRAAKEHGLNVVVTSGGTDPDPQVGPAIAAHLQKNGYDVPIVKPTRAKPEDVAAADVVISIGCDLSAYPTPRGRVEQWDVPSTSEHFEEADAVIRKHVDALIRDLVRQQKGLRRR